MSQFNRAPIVNPELAQEVAPGVIVLPDQRISFVPNIGIVIGNDAVLVIDCGMGVENGKRVLQKASALAEGKRLLLTSTHFHPEHAYGAQAFKGHATIISNVTQADELLEKGEAYRRIFRGFSPAHERMLRDVELIMPDETYRGKKEIDLGGKLILLQELSAHTRGDQIIFLPQEQVLFTGDLAETCSFLVFPPDQDAKGEQWIEALAQMMRLSPTTVVPGHGEISEIQLLQELQDYLIFVRNEVHKHSDQGVSLEMIEHETTSSIKERYPNWDEEEWIPSAIRKFYSELTENR